MYQDNIVLLRSKPYEQKYYFNQDFASLPETVKQELQIMCVLFYRGCRRILTLEFDEDGSLQFKTEALEADARFDEIGSALKIKEPSGTKESFWNLWKCITRYFSWEISRMRNCRKSRCR